MEKKKIYIIGGCRGCGATFVAAGLAFAMGRRPEGEKKGIAYLEGVSHDDGPGGSGHSLPYYELSLDRHISAGRFSDMFAVKREGKDPSNRLNLYGNVNWAVRTDMSPAGVFLSPEDVAGRFVLWDSPGASGAAYEPDLVIFVFDVLPSRVVASVTQKEICRKLFGNRMLWVMNRVMDKPYEKTARQAERYLGIRADYCIENEPFENILSSELCLQPFHKVNGLHAGNTGNIGPANMDIFDSMAEHILGLY